MLSTGGTTTIGLYDFKKQLEDYSDKADKTYVDNALTSFTNGAAKFYPTLAEANADIANIGIKDKVEIGEVANGGTWYKATAGATSLTKSPFDAVEQAKVDATTKANTAEANAIATTDSKFAAYMTGTQVLVKNYNSADFSIIDSFVQNDVFYSASIFNRTDYIPLKAGDVANVSVFSPGSNNLGSVLNSDYTFVSDIVRTSGTASSYSVGTYTATQDCFIIINQNKTDATYANPTIVVNSKDRLVANSNLNTVGSALGYSKYISALGGSDIFVDAYLQNTSLSTATSVYTTLYGATGDFNNKLKQGFVIGNIAYTALVSLPIPVYAGTRIKGKVARTVYQQSLLLLNSNKKPVKFLDTMSTANTSLQTVDFTVDIDGYLVVQHHSVTLQCDLRIFSKTRLMNSDMKDRVGGYLSYEYYKENIDKNTELDITANVKAVTKKDRVKFNNLGVEATDTGYYGSAFIACIPNLTFIIENQLTRNGASVINFYDANYNFISGVYGDSDILSYQKITSPENTAYVRFCTGIDIVYGSSSTNSNGTVITYDLAKFKLVLNASGVYYYNNYLLPMMNDLFLDVRGDSIGQGIGGAIIAANIIQSPTVRNYCVGGEGCIDTMMRAGAISVEMRTRGLTVPADGSPITVEAYFDFTRTVTYNADGSYSNSGGFRKTSWGPGGTSVPFSYDGRNFLVNMSSDTTTTIRLATAGTAYTFSKDTAFTTKLGTNKGLLFTMMGTNGGFGPLNVQSSFDNLLMMHKRITDTYQGKCIVSGYYYTGKTYKAYYRQIMEREYGERFIDFETHILTRGISEMGITLNDEEKSFIATHQGMTSGGGNSAIPLISADNTHPMGIVYRCFTNEMLRRAYLLGFIDKLYELDLQIPTSSQMTITPASTNIAIGGTATAQVALTGSDAYRFQWSSSNEAVATVVNPSWVSNYTSRSTATINGVSAGTATITCTCRYGGSTKSFDITVA